MKRQKRIVIALVVIILIMLAAIAVILLTGGNKKKYREQLDLGKKYVSEEKYEEALLCFETAMNIEPKEEEPYLCMAEVYEIQGDFDNMVSILKLGCERAKTAKLEEELQRAEALAEEAKNMQGMDPDHSEENPDMQGTAPAGEPVELTMEEMAEVSEPVNVVLDWNMHPDSVSQWTVNHISENILEDGKKAGERLNFLLRCFRNMEFLYPEKIENLAGNYGQIGAYYEEWAWHYPVSDRPAPAFTDWSAELDLSWMERAGEGISYSVSAAFYLDDFNQMLTDVFGGAVPSVTPEEFSGYQLDTEYSLTRYFLYDKTHGAVCYLLEDGRTGGDWEPYSMFHNYITKAVKTGNRIELEIQKLSIDGLALYQDLVSSRYNDVVSAYDMSKEDYWNTQGKIYTSLSGQPLAVDGQEILVLQPIHSYLEDFEEVPYEDMEVLEFDQMTGEILMTREEVFTRLQEHSAALLEDPGIAGPYFRVGSKYRAVLEEKDGYYQFLEIIEE